MRFKAATAVVLIVALTSLGGCVKVDTSTKTPTVGSQLMDLSKARALGDLTDEEFEQLRTRVLASF